jgi:hypothetical protein
MVSSSARWRWRRSIQSYADPPTPRLRASGALTRAGGALRALPHSRVGGSAGPFSMNSRRRSTFSSTSVQPHYRRDRTARLRPPVPARVGAQPASPNASMLASPALPVVPKRPAIERVVLLLAYDGYPMEADAVLYGMCNHALWGDDDLHAAVLLVHHGPQRLTRLMAAARAGDAPSLTRLLRARHLVPCAGARTSTALPLMARPRCTGRRRRARLPLSRSSLRRGRQSGQQTMRAGHLCTRLRRRAILPLSRSSLRRGRQSGQQTLSAPPPCTGLRSRARHRTAQQGQTAAIEVLLAAGLRSGR